MRTEQDIRKDVSLMERLFQRLVVKKEREVGLARNGKRLPPGEVKEMRDLETNIEAIIQRNSRTPNLRIQRLFEAQKNKYELAMRGWNNRINLALQAFERMIKRREEKGS